MSSALINLGTVFGPLFSNEDLTKLAALTPGVQTFSKDDFLITEGEVTRDLFIQLTGRTKVTKSSQPDLILGELRPGFIYGEVTFFQGGERTANIRAIEETQTLSFTPDSFETLSTRLQIKLLHNLLPRITRRFKDLHQTVIELTQLEKEQSTRPYNGNPLSSYHLPESLLFSALFTAEESEVIYRMKPGREHYQKGDRIFTQGPGDGSLFILLKGTVTMEKEETPGITLFTLGPGRLLGISPVDGVNTRFVNVIANDDYVEGIRFSIQAFVSLPETIRIKMYKMMFFNIIDRMKYQNIAILKLEHMKQNVWFGG
ncbi:MAG: cyclic nucleotide-binding domain-containing protein [Magnetococcales bacterium]|nr:cyclic nucleotide-binding domain-containing protein [Magnetococcales bacterium]